MIRRFNSYNSHLCDLCALRGFSSLRRGFTLVEAAVATTILGVAVTAVVLAASRAIQAQQWGRARETAAILAAGKLSEVEVVGPLTTWAQYPLRGTFEPDYPEYEWDLSIEAEPLGQLYDVTLTVTWPARKGREEFSVTTLLNEYTDLTAENAEKK